jgi:hypothetical protein
MSQLARRRASAARAIAAAFATVIRIEDGPEIEAARWNASTSAGAEGAGLLPVADVSFRIPRNVAADYTLRSEVTRITEGEVTFRLMRTREAVGDPWLVLECVAL